MMINQILTEIINAIKNEFDGCKIYSSPVEQGVDAPCFVVLPLSVNSKIKGRIRSLDRYSFSVTYISADKEDNEDCLNVSIPLMYCLKSIGSAYCFDMGSHIEDGALVVDCSYNVHVLEEEIKENMEVLEIENNEVNL